MICVVRRESPYARGAWRSRWGLTTWSRAATWSAARSIGATAAGAGSWEAAFGGGAALAVALGHAVDRAGLLHFAFWPDGITFLEQLIEGRAYTLVDRILQALGQIGEGGIAMNPLEVTKQVVGQAARSGLQGFDRLDHRGDEDGLHDVGRRFRHWHSPLAARPPVDEATRTP